MRILIRFLIINVVFAIVGVAFLSKWPKQLHLVVETQSEIRFDSSCDRVFSFSPQKVESRVFLPMDCQGNELSFSPATKDNSYNVKEARLISGWTIGRKWGASDVLVDSESGKFKLEEQRGRFYILPLSIGVLLGIEFLIILFCIVLNRLPRFEFCPAWSDALLVSMLLSTFFVIIVPCQTWLANAQDFKIDAKSFATDSIIPFLSFLVVSFSILMLSRRWMGFVLPALCVAIVVCCYLETGILSFDYPPLDGETVFYFNRRRGVIELILFGGIIGLVVWLGCRLKRFVFRLSVVLMILSFASICDVKKEHRLELKSDIVDRFFPRNLIVDSFVHSAHTNVAVYVLDSVSIPHVCEVFERDPKLRSEFEGFSIFTNNVGMHMQTISGVAGMTTGEYYDNPNKLAEYSFSCFTSKSFLKNYLDAGSTVFFCPWSYEFGYTNYPLKEHLDGENAERSGSYFKRIYGQQRWNLFELCRFRLVPFILKSRVLGCTSMGWDDGSLAEQEKWCLPRIAQAPISKEIGRTLQFWHTRGSHGGTYMVNRDGFYDGIPRSRYEVKIEATWYLLKLMARHFKQLKERNLYDNTFLVMTADHGSSPVHSNCDDVNGQFEFGHEEITSLSGRMQPILFVKPLNSRGKAVFLNVPTSHSKICRLVKDVLVHDINRETCNDILCSSNRLYRIDDGMDLFDCVVDANRRMVFKKEKAVAFSDTIKLNYVYSLYATNTSDLPPIQFYNSTYWGGAGPRMKEANIAARFTMKVPSPNAAYSVELVLKFIGSVVLDEGGCALKVRDQVGGGEKVLKNKAQVSSPEKINFDVKSDSNCMVSFELLGNGVWELRSFYIVELDK